MTTRIGLVVSAFALSSALVRAADQKTHTSTVRLLQQSVAQAAREVSDITNAEFRAGRRSGLTVYRWSARLLAAERAIDPASLAVKSARRHLDLMVDVDPDIKLRVARGQATTDSYVAGDYFRHDALIAERRQTGAGVARDGPESTARLAAARLVFTAWQNEADLVHKEIRAAGILFWSRRILAAELERVAIAAERAAAYQSFIQRAKDIQRFAESLGATEPPWYVYELDADIGNAELMLLQEHVSASAEKRAKSIEAWGSGAARAYHRVWTWTTQGPNMLYLDQLYEVSCLWRQATLAAAKDRHGRIAANEDHVNRMIKLQQLMASQDSPSSDDWAAAFYVTQAQLWLAYACVD